MNRSCDPKTESLMPPSAHGLRQSRDDVYDDNFSEDDVLRAVASRQAVTGPCNDAIVAYVLGARPIVDRLRQAAGQLAGILVLAAARAREMQPDHFALSAARAAHAEAAVKLASLAVPEGARLPHDRALSAAHFIGIALERCTSDAATYARDARRIDDALRPLREGYAHLERAAAVLPGVELVGFSQSCCSTHPAIAGRSLARRI